MTTTKKPRAPRVRTEPTEVEAARMRLREWITPGATIFCILRHRSASGMSRTIELASITGTAEAPNVSVYGYNTATALGWSYDRQRDGVKVSGCGMDMGFHLVYELASALFGDGATKDAASPVAEVAASGAAALAAVEAWQVRRKAEWEHANTSAGYALTSRWL